MNNASATSSASARTVATRPDRERLRVSGAGYLGMDEWMRPAVARGLWIASASAAAIVLTGLAAVTFASRTSEPSFSER